MHFTFYLHRSSHNHLYHADLVKEHAEHDSANGDNSPAGNLEHTGSRVWLLSSWSIDVSSWGVGAAGARARVGRSSTSRWSITLELELVRGNVEAWDALGEGAGSNELNIGTGVEGVLLAVVLGGGVLELDGGDVSLLDVGWESWESVALVAAVEGGDGVGWSTEVALLGWVGGSGEGNGDIPGVVGDGQGNGTAS